MRNIICFILLLTANFIFAQKYDNHWLFGYSCNSGFPLGGTELSFTDDSLKISNQFLPINMDNTNASISNSDGELVFYTNGWKIANGNHVIVANSAGLNPEPKNIEWGTWGNRAPQGAIFLPHPTDTTLFYLIHGGVVYNPLASNPTVSIFYMPNLYVSILEKNDNFPNGNLLVKNQIVATDTFCEGTITATKHGNGRDWWVLIRDRIQTVYHRFLLSSSGFQYEGEQNVHSGTFTNPNLYVGWQACFSPDGSKYARYECDKIHLYDFDRCTGLLINFDSVNLVCDGSSGIAFSPNSKVLYVSLGEHIYQYDVSQNNLSNSGQMISLCENYIMPPPWPALDAHFFLMQLAPDNKIYMSSPTSVPILHVIDYPDSLGTACSFRQHAIQLSGLNAFGIPNFPNYRLGAKIGSPCDTLSVSNQLPTNSKQLTLYPNPTQGNFTIEWDKPLTQPQNITIINPVGQVIYQTIATVHTTTTNIHLPNLNKGLYYLTIGTQTFKILVE